MGPEKASLLHIFDLLSLAAITSTSYSTPKFSGLYHRRTSPIFLRFVQCSLLGSAMVSSRLCESLPKSPVSHNFSASTYSLTARLEVIVSCGAISTPHLLQLSGIGDATQLKAANIRPIVPLQHVGKNLQDHPLFTQPYLVNEGNDLDQFIHNDTFQIQALDEWHRTRKGIMGLSFSSMTGWLRSSALNSSLDQSAGSRSPHFAMIFTVSQPLRSLPGVELDLTFV